MVPTVMLFVPSVEGISPNEAEDNRDEDARRGVELLTEVTRRGVRGELETVSPASDSGVD